MKILYCESWSDFTKTASKFIDEEVARMYHDNKQPYTVIMKERVKAGYVIEISREYISVKFLDNRLQTYLSYIFNVKSDNKIFLGTTYYYKYNVMDLSIEESIEFYFEENGNCITEEKDWKTGEIKRDEKHCDVSVNWDKYPEFGKYDCLYLKERE